MRRRLALNEPLRAQSINRQGAARATTVDGKPVRIDLALEDELVTCEPKKKRRGITYGVVNEVIQASDRRISARCKYFEACGGCSFQHLEASEQRKQKELWLLEDFASLELETPALIPAISDVQWGYRRRARLGVKYVEKKGGVIIGFRERHSSLIQPIEQCEVLHPSASELIPSLRQTIADLSVKDRIPQVEISVANEGVAVVIRHLEAFTTGDINRLRKFVRGSSALVYLQSAGLDTVRPLESNCPPLLSYNISVTLGDICWSACYQFAATDFVQIHAGVNQQMVAFLLIHFGDIFGKMSSGTHREGGTPKVLDLFCGIGNFSIPLAQAGFEVCGIEGDATLVSRAKHNATRNQLDSCLQFYAIDLYQELPLTAYLEAKYDAVVLDPPRSGAEHVVAQIERWRPKHIVYFSCNSITLARDSAVLVNAKGYRMRTLRIIDMFPQTNHFEAVACYEKIA